MLAATNNPAPQFYSAPSPSTANAMMMEHQHQHQHQQQIAAQRRPLRKRKPEAPPENNERLSKRLSLLNLEHSGTKLYIPVESQQQQPQSTISLRQSPTSSPTSIIINNKHNKPNGVAHRTRTRTSSSSPVDDPDSMMQLDDSKYKVYIRNLDDELSSESEPEEGSLIFLPDIEKHLRNNRIPPSVLAKPDPELLDRQLVLYSVPSSLSVPEEQDSVRKAIIEARARVRLRAQQQQQPSSSSSSSTLTVIPEADMVDDDDAPISRSSGEGVVDDDSDAMELD